MGIAPTLLWSRPRAGRIPSCMAVLLPQVEAVCEVQAAFGGCGGRLAYQKEN